MRRSTPLPAPSLHRAAGSLPRWTTTQMIYNVGYKSDFCCVNLAPQGEESQEKNVAFTQHKDPARSHTFTNGFKVCYLNVQFTQPRARIFVSPTAFWPAHFLFLRRSFLSYFLCATKWGLCLSRICPPASPVRRGDFGRAHSRRLLLRSPFLTRRRLRLSFSFKDIVSKNDFNHCVASVVMHR